MGDCKLMLKNGRNSTGETSGVQCVDVAYPLYTGFGFCSNYSKAALFLSVKDLFIISVISPKDYLE